jgi:hypothetical protein
MLTAKGRPLKWVAWIVALAFVLTVSIQRTGTATDQGEESRKQIAEALNIARGRADRGTGTTRDR